MKDHNAVPQPEMLKIAYEVLSHGPVTHETVALLDKIRAAIPLSEALRGQQGPSPMYDREQSVALGVEHTPQQQSKGMKMVKGIHF